MKEKFTRLLRRLPSLAAILIAAVLMIPSWAEPAAQTPNYDDPARLRGLALANEVISDPDSLRKQEADGDSLFYDEDDNEFAVLSSDGYIRTLFRPDDGIEYWNRQ